MKTLHTIYTNFAKRLAVVLVLLLTLGVTSTWGAEYSLTPNQASTGSNSSSYITSLTEFTYNGISWKMNQWNPSTLQVKTNQGTPANEFRFYNTSAFPGKITKVVITFETLTVKVENGFMFIGGTSEQANTTGGTSGTWDSNNKTITWTPAASDNFTYFAFYQNGKVASGNNFLAESNSIVVTYESGYAVTYKNGGRGTAPRNTTASSVKLSAITATGYTNTGWKADVAVKNGSNTISAGTLINNGTTVTLTQATTFTAQWQANKYTITLDNQSATSTGTTSVIATYDSNSNLTSAINIPSKTHHNFGGYYTQTNGNGTQLIDSEGKFKAGVSGYTDADKIWKYANNITLYAKWTEKNLVRYRTSCACIPPTVSIQPTTEFGWRYSIGETIGLNAIVEGASGDCTYQWQKYVVDQWQDIAGATSETFTKENCDTDDGGSYRCVVNAGNDCIAESEPYYVRVFTLNGYYYNEEIAANKIEWTGENTGVATIHLGQSRTYLFKVTDNEGKWFGYGDYAHFNYIVQPWQADCGIETGNGTNTDIRLFTGPEGDYTFTINIEHALDDKPYVNIAVAYPEVEHPIAGYGYVTKWWDHCYIHWWDNNDQALTEWGSDAQITTYTEICETEYYFFPIIDNYINLIIKDKAGDPSNTTEDQTQTGHSGWYITHDGNSWGWHEFATYTITFDANGGNGTMDALSGICPTTNKTLTTNAFTRSGYTFAGWKANKNVTINGVSVVAGTLINDCATIQNIVSDITLTAQWTPKNITITWDANGGSVTPTSSTYTYNGTTITPPTPTRANYIFNGWFTAATGGTKITEVGTTNKPTEDVTYYAQWTEKATPTFAWSDATCTAALEADNTFPTLSNPNSLSVTYKSSDEDVAKINSNGNITLGSEGRTTITAIGAETATYKSATDTYELIVVAANCKWIETDIADINSGDEVVITMTDVLLKTYALPNDEVTDNTDINVIVMNAINGHIENVTPQIIWNISKNGDILTFESKQYAGKFLTCNNADKGVRVNNGENKQFVIDETYGYLKNQANARYLGVHNDNHTWYCYKLTDAGNFPLKIVNQTLKFYKRECLDSEHYWVTWDAGEGTWEDKSSKKLESYEFGAEITKPENPTREGYKFTGWTPAPTIMPAQNTTFTAQWAELHTITWMVGSSSVLSEEVANGTGVTKTPASNPEGDAIGDCADTFLGWSEKSAGSTPQDAAYYDDLCTAAQMKSKHNSVTGDKIFYAVFATATTTPGTSTTTNKTYSHTITATTWEANGSQTLNGVSWTLSNNGNYYGHDETKGQQVGSGSKPAKSMTLTTSGFASASKITSVTINTSGASDTNAKVSVKVGGTSYLCNSNTSPSITTTATAYEFTGNSTGDIVISWSQTSSKAIYFKSITVKYSNTTTTPEVTEYSDYVTNCCALAPATNLTVSGTTSNTATLTWTAPSPATGITKLQVRNAADDAVVVDNIAVGTTTATITGLTECTKYNYYVASVGDCEVFSNIVTVQPFSNAKTVNYDYNGGSGSPASFTTSCEKQEIVLPAATRTGYDFNGWYTAATGGTKVGDAGDTYNPTTSPITLYAQWTKQIYIISFHANGGSGTMANQQADENDKIAQLNANQFTRDGYAFVGWNTKANGTGIAYADQATDITLTGNLTLYAQWAPVVTLNDAGNEETAHPTAVNGTITLPDGANACKPYEFVGWTSVAIADWNGEIEEPELVTSPYKPTAPITLYAVYKIQDEGNPNAFKLSFEGSNGKTYYVGEYASSPYLRGFSNITTEEAVTFIRTKMYPDDDTKYYLYLEYKEEYYYYNSSYGFSTTSSAPNENQGWVFHTVGDKIQIQAIGQERYLSYVEPGSSDTRTNITTHATGSQGSFNMLPAVTSTYVAAPLCNQEITITFETGNGDFVANAPATNPLTVNQDETITLPTCEYPGYEFMGWLKDEQQPDPSDIPLTYYTGDYTVSGKSSSITFYAYYKAVPEEVEFTGTDDTELLMYYYDGANYYYASSFDGENGELPSMQNCFNATTWTFTNVGNMQYYIQDETGKYLGAVNDNDNDLSLSNTPKVWNFTLVNGLWKMVCEDSPSRALMYISTGKKFANAAISNEGNGAYSYVTLGICPYPTYTTNPVLSQGFSITNTATVTSASGQKVKATSALTLETRNIELPCTFTISAPNITFYDNTGAEVTELTASAASEQFELHFAYKPTAENTMEYPTITITDDEMKTYTIKNRIYARSLPATFAIVAKVGNIWYALPSQGLNSTTPPAAYPIEVDDIADPTAVTAVPDNADWSLRGVYEASRSDATKDRYVVNGDNLVFVNNASPAMALNASTSGNYLLTDAQYANYYQTNPGLYEWTPTTTDLETYQLTNEQRSITLSVNTATVFGVHATDKAVEQVRFLPIQNRYTPAALQVVEWKENSVVIMYNGDPAQTASVSVNGAAAQNTTLSAAQRDIAVYELTATGLADNPTQRLSITIGTEKVILSIPYIISGAQTDYDLLPGSSVSAKREAAKIADLIVLNAATLTAAGAKSDPYKFRNVTIYGGGKLVIPSEKGFGVSSLTMRLGTVNDDGSYTNSYPQLVLNGTINTGNINVDYLTTYDRYYALSLPYEVNTTSILYPADIYGDNLKDGGNNASFALQYYDGEARAHIGKGWKDLGEPADLVAYKGYTFWGAPRKVKVNGATEGTRQKYGIHRIPITETASDLMKGEKSLDNNGNVVARTIDIYAHPAERPNDMGWNFLGNPYLAQYGGLSAEDEDVQVGLLEHEMVDGKWTGGWKHTGNLRYVTTTTDGQNYTAVEVDKATFSPFNTFFIQAATSGQLQFAWASRAQSLPARQYAAQQETAKEITTGIILTGNDQTDRTGLLIADNFTEEYDFNADLSKFENSGINLYTIGKDGNLAYMAINQALAEQPIPVGYTAPAEGLYTIAFDEDRYNATDISALYLIDYDSNEKTNLLHTDYSFVTAAGTNNQRFALHVAFAPENATNVEWVGDGSVQAGVEGNTLMLNNLPTDAAVHVFDALGRLMYHAPTVPTEMQLTLPTGYYLVRIADKQNAIVIKTVIP